MTAGTNMKYQYQIVGTAQYEYIMGEDDFESPEAAVEAYKALREAFHPLASMPGLSSKDWNNVLDSYINGNPMAPDTYYAMSPEQQKIIQELKKCFKRIKSKNGETEID